VLRRGACHPPVSQAWHDRGVPLLFGILVSAGVIFAIFAVTVGRGGSMTQFQPDWPGQPLPQDRPVRASDLADARFSVAFRGYRMAEVDEALDRLAVEIAQRDERIQQLTGQPFEADPPAVTVVPATGEMIAHDPAAYDPAAERPDDTAIYQPSAPYDPNAPRPYAYEFNPYDPGASDPSLYQPPQPDPTPPAPPAGPRPYEPHGYPPGVLDGGGHPTQPIPPVPDPSTTDQPTER
jgi:DivIVA domain-containing protein